MPKTVWKGFTYAIYLDTNALIASGPFLDQQWINELLSITNEFKIDICVSELVVSEWCENILNVLKNSKQSLISQNTLLKHFGIGVPEIKSDEIQIPDKNKLYEILSLKLKNIGFKIIPNWDAPLSILLNEAVTKKLPFVDGGKGFCDAVILESFIKHAKENYKGNLNIFVVSKDKAVISSEERFNKHGINVVFCDHQSIIEKLKSVLSEEIAAFIQRKKEKLLEQIKTHKKEIFDYIEKSPLPISDFMLLVMKRDKEERFDGEISKILSIKPIEIYDAIGGLPTYKEQFPSDRYPIMIMIDIELTVVIKKYDSNALLFQTRALIQPSAIDPNSPIILKDRNYNEPQEIIRSIKRYMSILATIDAVKEKDNLFEDFRIEKTY